VQQGVTSYTRYDHYSTGRTIEQALGLAPITANDAYATPLNDAFTGNSTPPPPSSSITPTETTIPAGQPLTVDYSTPSSTNTSTNWIGIYPVGVKPGSQASLTWHYAPGTSGDVQFSASSLPAAGTYDLYYLYDNGYSILAGPVPITIQ
jgi:cytoskeletal protein RodZ